MATKQNDTEGTTDDGSEDVVRARPSLRDVAREMSATSSGSHSGGGELLDPVRSGLAALTKHDPEAGPSYADDGSLLLDEDEAYGLVPWEYGSTVDGAIELLTMDEAAKRTKLALPEIIRRAFTSQVGLYFRCVLPWTHSGWRLGSARGWRDLPPTAETKPAGSAPEYVEALLPFPRAEYQGLLGGGGTAVHVDTLWIEDGPIVEVASHSPAPRVEDLLVDPNDLPMLRAGKGRPRSESTGPLKRKLASDLRIIRSFMEIIFRQGKTAKYGTAEDPKLGGFLSELTKAGDLAKAKPPSPNTIKDRLKKAMALTNEGEG